MTTTTAPAPAPAADREHGLPGRRSPRRLLTGVGVVLTGAVAVVAIGATTGRDAVERVPATVVEDGRWGGPDVYEPRDDPGPRYGSADTLERPGQV